MALVLALVPLQQVELVQGHFRLVQVLEAEWVQVLFFVAKLGYRCCEQPRFSNFLLLLYHLGVVP